MKGTRIAENREGKVTDIGKKLPRRIDPWRLRPAELWSKYLKNKKQDEGVEIQCLKRTLKLSWITIGRSSRYWVNWILNILFDDLISQANEKNFSHFLVFIYLQEVRIVPCLLLN